MGEFSKNRRLTTILAADIVGYSKHMAADEDATLRNLQRHMSGIKPLIEAKGGRIFHTTGDGFLAEYKSTLEAVRSAIEIQEEVARINEAPDIGPKLYFRVGINVGDVIDDNGNLFGDGVNIAARLESLATAGGICVSSGVYELVRNKLSYSFQSMGDQQVKNIPEPISTFTLTPVHISLDPSVSESLPKPDTISAVSGKSWKTRYFYPGVALAIVILLAIAVLKPSPVTEQATATTAPAQSSSPITKKTNSQPSGAKSTSTTPSSSPKAISFAGKWVIGSDGKKAKLMIELLSSGKSRISIQNLKNKKVRKLNKSGTWSAKNSQQLCLTLPSAGQDSCFRVETRGNKTYLYSEKRSTMDWMLVNKP